MSGPQLPHDAPAGTAHGELGEEARLGGSELGRATNAALLALSRTARSFTLYDARNQAVREFLAELRTKLSRALDLQPAGLELQVRAFELLLGGEVVYLERERERSLAFRLYRDGVRSLTLLPGLDWDDLLGLVEILSLRYAGVRQQEDDLVTLFAKAGFAHVRFTAIEGFSADEEVHEEGHARQTTHVVPPADWDLPLPGLPPAVAVAARALPSAALAALRAEHADDGIAKEALALVLALLERVDDPLDPLEEADVEALVFEVRDYLLSEGRYAELLALVAALGKSAAGDMRPRASILARLGGAGPLRHLVRRERRSGSSAPPAEAFAYLRAVPGNPLADLVDLLSAEQDEAQRATLRALVAGLAGDRPRLLLERIEQADARLAAELLGALHQALPELAVDVALKLKERAEPTLQRAAISVLGQAELTPPIARALVQALSAARPDVRSAAVEALAGFRDPRVMEALTHHAHERAGHGLTEDEAELLGEALARQDPSAALGLFAEWLHPRTLLQRVALSPGQRLLHRVAVAGLARIPGEEAEKQLRWFLGKSTGPLHQYCLAALVQRRREQHGKPEAGHAG